MYRLKIAKKMILIFVDVSQEDNVEYLIVKGNKILKKGACSVSELEQIKLEEKVNYARISFYSELAYSDIVNLRLHNKKLLDVVVKRYINEQSIFVDDFVSKSKVLNLEGTQAKVAIFALPRRDLDFLKKIKKMFIVEYVIPTEGALLKYAQKINREAEVILWLHNNLLLEMDLQDGFIQNRRMSEHSGSLDDVLNFENRPFVSFNSDDPKDEAEKYAHLLGLIEADSSFDFTDKEYFHEVVSYELSKAVFALSVALFVFSSAYGLDRYLYLKRLDFELNNKLGILKNLQKEISGTTVSQNDVKIIGELSKYNDAAQSELDLGKFLTWITHIVPKGSVLSYVKVSKSTSNSENNPNQINANQTQTAVSSNLFSVKLALSMKGGYDYTKKLAVNFLSELSKRVKPQNSKFVYNKENGFGVFTTVFNVDGRSF